MADGITIEGQSKTANPRLASDRQTESEVDVCWNRIGVYGDHTCPELVPVVHCRNCGVFSRAGTLLLNRPLGAEYREEWTQHIAREKASISRARVSALLFRIGPEWLGLPTDAFQEVAERRPIHSLPHRRQGMVVGLVNIRGELLICVSLARLLDIQTKPAAAPSARAMQDRLLVVKWDGQRLVCPVEEVHGIHRFLADEL